MFFFVVVMAYDWSLPARLLILICILNDAATLVISVDNAKISPHPDKWRIGQLISLSIILGACLTALSFAHFYIFWYKFGYEPVEDSPLESVMYLHISSAPHFTIFSTRLAGYFWENLPSPLFSIVIIGTQIVALLMVGFGGLTKAIPWSQAVVILLISFAYFVLLDFVKVQIFRVWSFELTAYAAPTPTRREKLRQRKERQRQQEHVWTNIDKLREVTLKARVLEALNTSQSGNQPGDKHEVHEEGRLDMAAAIAEERRQDHGHPAMIGEENAERAAQAAREAGHVDH